MLPDSQNLRNSSYADDSCYMVFICSLSEHVIIRGMFLDPLAIAHFAQPSDFPAPFGMPLNLAANSRSLADIACFKGRMIWQNFFYLFIMVIEW